MDFLNSLGSQLISVLFHNPALQAVFLGALAKYAVDALQQVFNKFPAIPEGFKVPVQLLVILLSSLATFGDLALKGQVNTIDPNVVVNFFTTVLPVYLSALGLMKGHEVVEPQLAKLRPLVKERVANIRRTLMGDR